MAVENQLPAGREPSLEPSLKPPREQRCESVSWISTAAAVWLLQHDSASLPASRLLYKMAAAASPPPLFLPASLPPLPQLRSLSWEQSLSAADEGRSQSWLRGEGKEYLSLFLFSPPHFIHCHLRGGDPSLLTRTKNTQP